MARESSFTLGNIACLAGDDALSTDTRNSADPEAPPVTGGTRGRQMDYDTDETARTNEGDTGHEFVDRTVSHGAMTDKDRDATFISAPYKEEIFRQQLQQHVPGSARRMAIINALQEMGVKVFIIDSCSTESVAEVIHHVRRVVGYIARENRVLPKTGPLGYQRCLLYQDHQGRLFNLVLSSHSIGPAAKWQDYLDSFSNVTALIALTLLCRSFSCIASGKSTKTVPGVNTVLSLNT
jgi:hypothetical protein